MTTVLITYEVDDVQHWLSSPTRTAAFESAGFSVRPFVDPTVEGRVALLVDESPRARQRAQLIAPYVAPRRGLDELQRMIGSPEASARMQRDGVRSVTMTTYVEG